jgi:hypothetical protein
MARNPGSHSITWGNKKQKKRSKRNSQPAVRTLMYGMDASGMATIDVAKDLSIANRKLFRAGRQYGIQEVEVGFRGTDPAAPGHIDTLVLSVYTAGDTWVCHNTWTKSKALWDQMNNLVLEDNPSIEGKWADFKVRLDTYHADGTAPLLDPISSGGPYDLGEWIYSSFTMPQHEVDPATGEPLPADITGLHLIGADIGVHGAFTSVGLMKAYAESRATVFDDNPNVPAGMSDSVFNLLTDSGSQEPELSLEIEYQNDDPPYNLLNYPQAGFGNADYPVLSDWVVCNEAHPNGASQPFVAECGLIRIHVVGTLNGVAVPEFDLSSVGLIVKLMPGNYKGVASLPMGQ